MPRTTRVNGKTPVFLRLSALSAPVSTFDASMDIVSVELGDGEGNSPVTFSDFAEGISPLALNITATWSGDTASLYHLLWKNAGRQNVAFTYSRHGNITASAGKPVLTGFVTIPPRTGWSAEAGDDNTDTFEVALQIESCDWNYAA